MTTQSEKYYVNEQSGMLCKEDENGKEVEMFEDDAANELNAMQATIDDLTSEVRELRIKAEGLGKP